MIFFRLVRYLKYILVSRHRKGHGIHSPFVYDLVRKVFWNKPEPEVVRNIERVRKRLKAGHGRITVRDLGSGAENRGGRSRKISEIAAFSAVPAKYGKLLANMAAGFGDPMIVEFGTSLGISTMYLAAFAPEIVVYTMEGCPGSAAVAAGNFEEAGLKNIKLLTGPFEDLLPAVTGRGISPGLVFIDGNHRKKPVLEYFDRMAEISDNKTVIIIDDIYYSEEMEEAWNEIKLRKRVSVTVDIFRMGIVFFREGIQRNNYIIRY
jgi:predicted O-methyltransferase YrrM